MKEFKLLVFTAVFIFALSGCGGNSPPAINEQAPSPQEQKKEEAEKVPEQSKEKEAVELNIFAAASMTETLNQIAELYKQEAPHVQLVFTFDSSGTLKTQIESGAVCDIFISAAQKQMNELDASQNNGELDFVRPDTRINIVENKVVLAVPKGNPSHIQAFEDVASDRIALMALGNSDVPVGQYAEEIFTSMGLWGQLNADQKITFGTNVKEVVSHVSEGVVDCGVVYATDAFSAGLEVVAEAPTGSHSPVVYPAAVLKDSAHQEEAEAYLHFLQTEAARAVFQSVGFSIPSEQ